MDIDLCGPVFLFLFESCYSFFVRCVEGTVFWETDRQLFGSGPYLETTLGGGEGLSSNPHHIDPQGRDDHHSTFLLGGHTGIICGGCLGSSVCK